MKITFVKRNNKLLPGDQDDLDALNSIRGKLQEGEGCIFSALPPADIRRAKHLRKYYAILQTTLNNSENLSAQYKSKYEYHVALKHEYCRVNPEMYETVVLLNEQRIVKTVFSVALDALPEYEWKRYYDFAIDICAKMLNISVDELEENSLAAVV